MGFKCCVPQCTSSSRRTNVFSIPQDRKLRTKWINAIGISEENITSTTRVCSLHFHEENFYQFSTCRKLKKGVIPQLNLTQVTSEDAGQLETETIPLTYNKKSEKKRSEKGLAEAVYQQKN